MYVFTHHIVYDYDIHLYTILGVLSQNMTMDFKFSNHYLAINYVKIIITMKDLNSPGAREPRGGGGGWAPPPLELEIYIPSKNFKNSQSIC